MPLVKARPGQEAELQRRLRREPYYNLFLISNLNEGLSDNLEVWLDKAAGGVLMRRHANWTLDAGPTPGAFDFAAAAAIMASFPAERVAGIVGQPEAVDPLHAALQTRGTVYEQRFAVMTAPPAPIAYSGTPRLATPADLDALTEFYANAESLSRNRQGVERNLGGTWLVEQDGRIVTAAAVTGQTDQAAMIGAVFTPPVHRRKGYASAVVHAMSAAMHRENLRPCLFYHNPEAGRIYLKLGFRELGGWRMVRFLGFHG